LDKSPRDYLALKLKKVLIVFKKSTLQLQGVEHKEPRFIKLVEEGHALVTRVKLAHEEHYGTLEAVKTELQARGIEYECLARQELDDMGGVFVEAFDLAVSVGGDGTFLDASHSLQSVPLVGINSARSSSFGHFCLGNETNFAQILNQIESGAIKPERLMRLELTMNGNVLPKLVLNEVLLSHSNPAGTTRYFLDVDGKQEEQKSSGIWVGPPSGSTGALRAAGGKVMAINAREFQYVVREPCPRPTESWSLTRGILKDGKALKVISGMRTGAIFVDGPHIVYRFTLGDELIVKASPHDLMAYVDSHVNDQFA
jgi:NAD+ kinase